MVPKDVAELDPEQVASILTTDRELLLSVTSKLSSGQNLSDLIFETDTSKLPLNGPTERALDALMQNPELARKALKLSLTALSKGAKKLSSGKALADELFGSDTSHLIKEAEEEKVGQGEAGPLPGLVEKVSTSSKQTTTSEAFQVMGMGLPQLPSLPSLNFLNPMAWLR